MCRRDVRADGGGGDESLSELLDALASTLRATEELPVSPSASIRLGEAHAVAADLADGDVDSATVHERVGHVRRLLRDADDVDNDAAAAHVTEALALTETILAPTDSDEEAS
jgi:hypothetical protein